MLPTRSSQRPVMRCRQSKGDDAIEKHRSRKAKVKTKGFDPLAGGNHTGKHVIERRSRCRQGDKEETGEATPDRLLR